MSFASGFAFVPFSCCCPCTSRNVTRLKLTWALAEIGVSIMDTGALSTSAQRLLYCTAFTASGDSTFRLLGAPLFPICPCKPPSNSSTTCHSPMSPLGGRYIINYPYANSGIAFLPRGHRPHRGHFVRTLFAGAVRARSMSSYWFHVKLRLLGCGTFCSSCSSAPKDPALSFFSTS